VSQLDGNRVSLAITIRRANIIFPDLGAPIQKCYIAPSKKGREREMTDTLGDSHGSTYKTTNVPVGTNDKCTRGYKRQMYPWVQTTNVPVSTNNNVPVGGDPSK
jgi:hypothetical protein